MGHLIPITLNISVGGSPSETLAAPTISWDGTNSTNNDNVPQVNIVLDFAPEEGDELLWYRSGIAHGSHTLTQQEIYDGDFANDIEPFETGDNALTLRLQRGGEITAVSNELTGTRDSAAPTLSSQSLDSISSSFAVLNVTTDEAGTFYSVAVPDGASAPNAAQIKAGHNASNAAVPSDSEVVGSSGAKQVTLIALEDATAYDFYIVLEDAALNPSNVVKVDGTTPAIATFTWTANAGSTAGTSSVTFTDLDVGTPSSDRLIHLAVGAVTFGAITGVTCDGSPMTLVCKSGSSTREVSQWVIAGASGTDRTFVCSFASSTVGVAAQVGVSTGLSATPTDTETANFSTSGNPRPTATDLTIPADGLTLAAISLEGGSNSSASWVTMDAVHAQANASTSVGVQFGIEFSPSVAGSVTPTVNMTPNTVGVCFAVGSFEVV